MQKVILSSKQVKQIAEMTADIVLRHLHEGSEPAPVYVNVKEAARIIGVSLSHMYKIKDEYSYIRRGDSEQGHIYFLRESLVSAPSVTENRIVTIK